MDASKWSQKNNPNLFNYYLKIESCEFPATFKYQRNPVVKYTKLPDFDFDINVSWPQQSYTLHPRLRRIINFQEPTILTSRSLKREVPSVMALNYSKRKIVTIIEDDESTPLSRKVSKVLRRPTSVRVTHKSVGTDNKEDKRTTMRSALRPSAITKYSNNTKSSSKINDVSSNTNPLKEANSQKTITKSKSSYNSIQSKSERPFNLKEKDTSRNTQRINMMPKSNTRKKNVASSESENEINLMKTKWDESSKLPKSLRGNTERLRVKKPNPHSRNSFSYWDDFRPKTKEVIIHAPLEETLSFPEKKEGELPHEPTSNSIEKCISKVDCATELDKTLLSRDANIGTEMRDNVNEHTAIDKELIKEQGCEIGVNTEYLKNEQFKDILFESLDIPNVTLLKDVSKENLLKLSSASLPNLQVPELKISPRKEQNQIIDPKLCKSASFIIGRATLTYTTRQKINFQVVSNSDDTTSSLSPSPLNYPVNVVSVYRKQIDNSSSTKTCNYEDDCNKSKIILNNNLNDLKYFKCPHEFHSKLIKPSEIISSIGVNRSVLQNNDDVCEQFQRELNFIDSFFESLQYLESNTLSEKCLSSRQCNNWLSSAEFVEKNFNNRKFLPKLENNDNNEDTETMVSKSLCLLNLLIRDEQRRAKNLLFVLKMREDALKDFTKSHILWLENKKKQDSTDISTLKKKQRGALLKLQFECGEMQRMRKALLSLSEKRKAALLKTKKNIELKLKNNIDVDQIILGKKKLRRNTLTDRNSAPLKCFDLSSSECDDSSTSRSKSVKYSDQQMRSAEKCIQTCDSALQAVLVNQENHTAAEHFVVVDGAYLNILFNNLALPQIFSSGKQYEVNEEALKNIVDSANTQQNNVNDCNVVENLMDNVNSDDGKSSTPSTARSLVDEFDHYYRALLDDKPSEFSLDLDDHSVEVCEIKDQLVQVDNLKYNVLEVDVSDSSGTVVAGEENLSSDFVNNSEIDILEEFQPDNTKLLSEVGSETNPFLVKDLHVPEIHIQPPSTPSSKTSLSQDCNLETELGVCGSISITSLNSPVHSEAEELRRQQLEIEREIQALEQQQSQLLVVREIPDKPPPPYTPPTESRATKPIRKFVCDKTTEENITKHISGSLDVSEPTDTFDIFIKDFCLEQVQNCQNAIISDNPWDSCNLLPQKPELDEEKLVEKTLADLKDVLTCVAPTVVSGVSNRRSDHIDDILFTEWRRYEPEWTALHVDEATIKNQVFESIFQKVLSETIDQYKKTVLGITSNSENIDLV